MTIITNELNQVTVTVSETIEQYTVTISQLSSLPLPLGGTSGQVLAKASNADTDVEWVDQAGGGGATNLGYTASPTNGTVTSDTGTDATILSTDGTNAGLFLPAEKTKLSGIESGATADPTASEIKTAYESNADTNAFTDAEKSKLSGIASGAEVNVNADWSAISGDAQILNKPTLGTAAAANTTDFATAAQGTKADSALQAAAIANFETTTQLNARDATNRDRANHSGTQAIGTVTGLQTALDGKEPADGTILKDADIGVSVQGYSAILANTTASFTTADETKLDGISTGAQANIEHGLISGGVLSINVDASKFNLSAGTGRIVDEYSDPLNPVYYNVSWSTFTAQTVTNLATSTVSFILVSNAGAIVQLATPPTEAQRRQNILLGQLGHNNLATIASIVPTPDIAASPVGQLRDLADAIGIINKGNVISANGANLNLNKTIGYLYRLGANHGTSSLAPTEVTIAAATAFSFRYRTRTGAGSTVSAIDPSNYDLAGVITALGVNKFTNQNIYLTTNGNVVIQYGQVIYNSMADAVAGVQLDAGSFVQFPNLTENFVLIGVLSVKQGATDLTTLTQARFFKTSKFGESAGAIAGTSISTLQQAYENSATDPEITTNTTGGAVAIRRGSAADTDNIFTGQNGVGTVTFSIKGNGVVSGDLSSCSGLKTINSTSIFGSGDIVISGASIPTPVGQTDKILTSNGTVESWQYPQNQNTTIIMRQLMGSPIIAENFNSSFGSAANSLSNELAYYAAIPIPFPTLVSGALYNIISSPSFIGGMANSIALYTYSMGTLTKIRETANDENIWKTSGVNQTSFSSPIILSKGIYFIGFIYTASSSTIIPTLRIQPATHLSFGETNSAKLFGRRNGQTSLPSSELMSNLTAASALHMALY